MTRAESIELALACLVRANVANLGTPCEFIPGTRKDVGLWRTAIAALAGGPGNMVARKALSPKAPAIDTSTATPAT